MDETNQDPEVINVVQYALTNSVGQQFGVLFDEAEAARLITALERQGWAIYPLGDAEDPNEPQSSPQSSTKPVVQVHVHVSASDTENQISQSMAAVRSALSAD